MSYLAQVSLYWLLLYGCYWLVLRRHTFFAWNRACLLGSLLGAFALPMVTYPEVAPPVPMVVYEIADLPLKTISVVETQHAASLPPAAAEPFPWVALFWIVYALGALDMAIRLFRQIRQVLAFIQQGTCLDMDAYQLYLLDNDQVGSYSFLNRIVINRTDYEHNFDTILSHELVHVRQRHSWDILLVEVLRVVFWFNPVLILYKRSLQQVHEYLADRETALPRDRYASFLVEYAFQTSVPDLTNQFFTSSFVKNRITMLYKNRNSNWSLGKYAGVALLVGFVALLAASCEHIAEDTNDTAIEESLSTAVPIDTVNEIREQLIPNYVTDSVYTVVAKDPEFPGGIKAMYNFIESEMKYPATARRALVQGKVFLTFVVNSDGSIQNIQVLKGMGFGTDEEAIRIMKQTPKWIPGEKADGEKVNVRYNLPITFVLPEKELSSNLREPKPKVATAEPRTSVDAGVDSLVMFGRSTSVFKQEKPDLKEDKEKRQGNATFFNYRMPVKFEDATDSSSPESIRNLGAPEVSTPASGTSKTQYTNYSIQKMFPDVAPPVMIIVPANKFKKD